MPLAALLLYPRGTSAWLAPNTHLGWGVCGGLVGSARWMDMGAMVWQCDVLSGVFVLLGV